MKRCPDIVSRCVIEFDAHHAERWREGVQPLRSTRAGEASRPRCDAPTDALRSAAMLTGRWESSGRAKTMFRPRALAIAAMFVGLLTATVVAADRKPNVIVFLGDDLGYADLGAQGGKVIPTPAIDSIARNGVRCA